MSQARSLDKAEENGGFSWIENGFIKELLSRISGLSTKVYLYLTSNTPFNKKSEQITKQLSASTIARALNSNRRSIVDALKELSELGAIEKVKEPGLPTRYRLLATCAEIYTRDEKEPAQGCAESYTPPEKKSSQVNTANYCETRAENSSKTLLRGSKILRLGIRPPQTPSGCGPRKV